MCRKLVPSITVIYPLLSVRCHHFTIVLTCIKRWHDVNNLFLHTRHKKIPCLFPQIIKTPEINVSNVFSVMIVPIVFEIQLSFCLQEKNIMGVISGGVRSVKHLEIPRFRDSPF